MYENLTLAEYLAYIHNNKNACKGQHSNYIAPQPTFVDKVAKWIASNDIGMFKKIFFHYLLSRLSSGSPPLTADVIIDFEIFRNSYDLNKHIAQGNISPFYF